MDLPSLTNKGLLIKGFSSLSGVSGASVGGWYASSIPNEFIWFESNVEEMSQSTNGNNKFSLKKNKCFKSFFPNLEKEPKFDLTNTVKTDPAYFKPEGASANSSETTGCSIMKLSTDVLNPEKFVFESETVIKNENIGIVIWASSKNVHFQTDSDSSEFTLRYRVLVLEKQNSNEKWAIKWGIAWNDLLESMQTGITVIRSPDGSIDFEGKMISNKEDRNFSNLQSKYYYGIWRETSDDSGNHILKDLLVSWKTKKEETRADMKPEILGSEGKFCEEPVAYTSVLYFYAEDDWKKHDGGKDYTQDLKDWFAPFEHRKGRWT